ncbi:hypothetical protein U2U65_003473 [Vibrio cholerae]|nr:hypothetical protein [Vibrio cholerae]EMA3788854.1 hypothetical protein [Vibrio cholerae]
MRTAFFILTTFVGSISFIAIVVFILATSQPPLNRDIVRLIPVQYADKGLVDSISENGVLSTIELDELLCSIKVNMEAETGKMMVHDSWLPTCSLSNAWPFQITSVDYGRVFPFLSDWLNEGKTFENSN